MFLNIVNCHKININYLMGKIERIIKALGTLKSFAVFKFYIIV